MGFKTKRIKRQRVPAVFAERGGELLTESAVCQKERCPLGLRAGRAGPARKAGGAWRAPRGQVRRCLANGVFYV